MKKMKAFILAGGLGTRLHPLTIKTPKPMLPISNRPILELIVEQILKKNGFFDITMVLYHRAEMIEDYFEDGKKFGVNIRQVKIPTDLGTAGALKFAADGIKDPFLVFSADLLTNINLADFVSFHLKKNALATIALTKISDPLSYGIACLDKGGRIKTFLEKPSWSEVFSNLVNAGIYVLEPEVLKYIPENVKFDFSRELFPLLIKKNKHLFGYQADGFWRDIGDLNEYGAIHNAILEGRGIEVEAGAIVSPGVLLEGDGLIGSGSSIDKGCVINASVIGRNCRIGKRSFIRDSIIWDDVRIGEGARLEGVIIGKGSRIGSGANLEEKSIIGENVKIGNFGVVRSYVKIWPNINIPSGVIVQRDLIKREEQVNEHTVGVA